MDGEVTPPPTKRRKLSRSSSDQSSGTITVYSWNVNGVSSLVQRTITSYFPRGSSSKDHLDGNDQVHLRNILRIHDWPALFFLQEIKVNATDTATLRAIEGAVRNGDSRVQEPDYVVHFCLPSDKYNARGFGGKVYGVACIVRREFSDKWVTCVRPVAWDKEGRVLVVETKAADGRPKLAIINVYAVNGTEKPYRDSASGDVVGTRHDRKLRLHELLAAECRDLEADDFGIIMAGDLNVARSTIDGHPRLRTFPFQHCVNRAHFEATFFVAPSNDQHDEELDDPKFLDLAPARLAKGLDMIDTFRYLHPTKKAYTYYPRNVPFGQSCDRVDMILATKSLLGNLVEAGMHETPAERGPSDHCPLYATFRFGTDI